MRLTIKEDAKDLILRKYPQATQLLLALNDGSNAFSSAEGCCMIGDRFMLVITPEVPAAFNVPVENPDFAIYMSSYEAKFIKGDLVLAVNPGTGSLMLKGDEGILDINVAMKEAVFE